MVRRTMEVSTGEPPLRNHRMLSITLHLHVLALDVENLVVIFYKTLWLLRLAAIDFQEKNLASPRLPHPYFGGKQI